MSHKQGSRINQPFCHKFKQLFDTSAARLRTFGFLQATKSKPFLFSCVQFPTASAHTPQLSTQAPRHRGLGAFGRLRRRGFLRLHILREALEPRK